MEKDLVTFKPSNILVDETAENAKGAAQVMKEVGDTQIMVAFIKPGLGRENLCVMEVNWQKILLVGLGMVSLGVTVWAGVKIYKSKIEKKKGDDK